MEVTWHKTDKHTKRTDYHFYQGGIQLKDKKKRKLLKFIGH